MKTLFNSAIIAIAICFVSTQLNAQWTNSSGNATLTSSTSKVGIGLSGSSAWGKLEIFHNSSNAYNNTQFAITENEATDYARMQFSNNNYLNYWHIAAHSNATSGNSQLNFYAKSNGIGRDVMTIRGNGRVGVNVTTPQGALEANTSEVAWTIIGHSYYNNGTGVFGRSYTGSGGYGIWGYNNVGGYAGYFNGRVHVAGNLTWTSDRNLKQGIQPIKNAIEAISKIDAVTYTFKPEYTKRLGLPENNQIGFIAQNVEQVFPELVAITHDKSEGIEMEYKAVNYIGMVPVTVRAIQEQQTIIEKQEATIAKQDERIAKLEALVNSLIENKAVTRADAAPVVTTPKTAELNACFPNPTQGLATITYQMGSRTKAAYIAIFNLNGQEMKRISVQPTSTSTNINVTELPSGNYFYRLVTDGIATDAQEIVIVK